MKFPPREYKLSIDGNYTPDNLPMDRLALYMQHFAALLGHRKSVHFSRIESGSAVVVGAVEPQDDPKVHKRITQTRKHIGPQDAADAYDAIDKLLSDDDAVGEIIEPDGAKVIEFPGRRRVKREIIGPVVEQTDLDGIPIVIGGQNDPVPVHLKDVDGTIHICEAKLDVARRLRDHLFDDPVRASGRGRWIRDENGEWVMKDFRILDFVPLRRDGLSEIVERLRETHKKSEWVETADPLGELEAIRDG